MAGKKTDNAQIQLKVNQILNLMIIGISRTSEIIRYVADMDKLPKKEREAEGWIFIGKKQRAVEAYVARAKEMLKEQAMKDLAYYKEIYTAQLDELYRRAVEDGKIRDANAIMANKIHLQGLGGFKVMGQLSGELSVKGDISVTMQDREEREKRIDELLKKRKACLEVLKKQDAEKK
jgi:hypothetical protein